MKKMYVKPTTLFVTLLDENPIATSITESEAASNATVLSREGRSSSWEDDEE